MNKRNGGHPINRTRRNTCLAVALLLTALTLGVAFSATGIGQSLDGYFFDTVVCRLGKPIPAHDILVVLITEEDYTDSATPMALWTARIVPLLEKFISAKPKAVGLDLILPRFRLNQFIGKQEKDVFRALKKLSQSCRLVSGYGITSKGRLQEPFVFYQKILTEGGYGYLNLTPDTDGVCRKQTLSLSSTKGQTFYSFASLLAGVKRAAGTVITPDWRNPARIATVSFKQALRAEPVFFSDKTIILGVNFEFEDRHPTPIPGPEEPGVVFHARVINALQSGRALHDPGWLISLILPALLVLPALLYFARSMAGLRLFLSGVGGLVAFFLLAILALAGGWVLRPSAGLMGIILVVGVQQVHAYFEVKDTFGRYVAPQVRDEILSGRVSLDGEIKEVTALFCDLRNFTPLVESVPPEQVVKILNGYFEEMSEAVRSNSGLVLQYVGDEIYAIFGAPLPDPDHARLAVRAGMEMRRRLRMVNQRLLAQGCAPLAHGIGIHSGKALAANIGGRDRLSYSLVGDTINLASRLQGLNKTFGTTMIISGSTRMAGIDDHVNLKALPATRVKGKSEPVEIFEVVEDQHIIKT